MLTITFCLEDGPKRYSEYHISDNKIRINTFASVFTADNLRSSCSRQTLPAVNEVLVIHRTFLISAHKCCAAHHSVKDFPDT